MKKKNKITFGQACFELYQIVLPLFNERYSKYFTPLFKENCDLSRLKQIEEHYIASYMESPVQIEFNKLTCDFKALAKKLMFEIISAYVHKLSTGNYASDLVQAYENVLHMIFMDQVNDYE